MKKIAITGASNRERLILCNALSYLIGYDVIRCIPYTGFAVRYGLGRKEEKQEWTDLYFFVLQSFIERIETESSYDEFISNGSVLNELAYMDAIESIKKKKSRSKDYLFMMNSLKSVITEYTVKKYDCIIHLAYNPQEINDINPIIDENLRELIKSSNVKTYLYKGNSLSEILENVFVDMNLKAEILPSTAIKKAELEFFVSSK